MRSARRPAGHWPIACATSADATITPISAKEAWRSRRYSGRIGSSEPIPVLDTKIAPKMPMSAARCEVEGMTEG